MEDRRNKCKDVNQNILRDFTSHMLAVNCSHLCLMFKVARRLFQQ